jgi:hypothetical protein
VTRYRRRSDGLSSHNREEPGRVSNPGRVMLSFIPSDAAVATGVFSIITRMAQC